MRERAAAMKRAQGATGQAAQTDDLEIWDETATERSLPVRLYRPRQAKHALPALVMYVNFLKLFAFALGS
jgi:hypothetical protein